MCGSIAGKPAGEVGDTMRLAAEFYDLYLNGAITPGEILAALSFTAPRA